MFTRILFKNWELLHGGCKSDGHANCLNIFIQFDEGTKYIAQQCDSFIAYLTFCMSLEDRYKTNATPFCLTKRFVGSS